MVQYSSRRRDASNVPTRWEVWLNLKTASLVATTVLIVALVTLLFRHALFANQPATIAAQVIAVGLLVWARMTFGIRSFHGGANPTEGGLVTTGPYRWLRHPIYASFMLFVWAAVIAHPDGINVALATVATAATAIRIVAEERLVVERYPEYAAYAARTRRLIPFVF